MGNFTRNQSGFFILVDELFIDITGSSCIINFLSCEDVFLNIYFLKQQNELIVLFPLARKIMEHNLVGVLCFLLSFSHFNGHIGIKEKFSLWHIN